MWLYNTFRITPKVNVIVGLRFAIVYDDVTVQALKPLHFIY